MKFRIKEKYHGAIFRAPLKITPWNTSWVLNEFGISFFKSFPVLKEAHEFVISAT